MQRDMGVRVLCLERMTKAVEKTVGLKNVGLQPWVGKTCSYFEGRKRLLIMTLSVPFYSTVKNRELGLALRHLPHLPQTFQWVHVLPDFFEEICFQII